MKHCIKKFVYLVGLALLGFQKPTGLIANPQILTKSEALSLSIAQITDQELDTLMQGWLSSRKQASDVNRAGRIKLIKYVASLLRSKQDPIAKNRLFSRLASFIANSESSPIPLRDLDKYLADEDLTERPSGLRETERFWFGLKAIEEALAEDSRNYPEGFDATLQKISNYSKKDLSTLLALQKIKSVGVQVEVLGEELLGRYTPEEQAWATQTAQLLINATEVLQPEHVDLRLPASSFSGEGVIIDRDDVFQRPSSREENVQEIAYDEAGNRIPLSNNPEMLKSILKEAQFLVPSKSFPGQFHRFQVRFIVSGQEKIRAIYKKGESFASNQVTLQIPRRFVSDTISYRNVIQNLGIAITESIDNLVGLSNKVPKYTAAEIESIIADEKAKQIAKVLRPVDPYPIKMYTVQQKTIGGNAWTEPTFIFETIDQNPQIIDLRLQKPETRKIVSAELDRILANTRQELESDRVQFLLNSENRLRTENPEWSSDQITVAVEAEWTSFIRHRALAEISKSNQLREIEIADLVVNEMRANFIHRDLSLSLRHRKKRAEEETIAEIEREFPRHSRNPKFKEDKRLARLAERFEALEDEFTQELIDKLETADLKQQLWIARKNAEFVEAAQRMREELLTLRKSAKTHEFEILRYPWDYKIVNQGSDEDPFYTAKVSDIKEVDTGKPFYRLRALWLRAASIFRGGNYMLAIDNLWNGPLGIRSLLGQKETYKVKEDVNTETGEWTYVERNTLKGRYKNVLKWRRELLRKFDERPDDLIVLKKYIRPLVWLYGGAGVALGTLAYPVGQTTLTMGNTALTGVGIATSFLWSPTAALAGNAFDAIIFDRLSHQESANPLVGIELVESLIIGVGNYFWGPAPRLTMAALTGVGAVNNLAKEGYDPTNNYRRTSVLPLPYQAFVTIGQGVIGEAGAATAGIIGHSVASVGSYLATLTTSGIMAVWDRIWYHSYLKPLGLIPATDRGIFTHRASGPGMASSYFYQIPPDLAVAGVYAWMEKSRILSLKKQISENLGLHSEYLEAYLNRIQKVIPQTNSIPGEGQASSQTYGGIDEFRIELEASVAHHQMHTKDLLDLDVKNFIKLTRVDLVRTIRLATLLLKTKGHEYLLADMNELEISEFWSSKDLVMNDWQGLSRYILKDIFGPRILTSLEDTDSDLTLEVDNSWGRWMERLDDGQIFQDADDLVVRLIDKYEPGLPGFESLLSGSSLVAPDQLSIDGDAILEHHQANENSTD